MKSMRQEANLKDKWLPTISFLPVILLIVLPIPSFSENKFHMICPDEVKSLLKTSIKVTGWVYTKNSSSPDGLILEIPRKIHTLKVINIQNAKPFFSPIFYFTLVLKINLHDKYILVFEKVKDGDLHVMIFLLDENSSLPYVCKLRYSGL